MIQIFVAAMISFGALAAPVSAKGTLPNQQVSLAAKNAGVRDLIKNLLDQTQLKYKLPAELSNNKKITMMVKNANWPDVFKDAIEEAGFGYSFDAAGTLVLKRR